MSAWNNIEIFSPIFFPMIGPGDDLSAIIANSFEGKLKSSDILVIAQKVVSKSMGLTRTLGDIVVSEQAIHLAESTNNSRSPEFCQVVIDASQEILAVRGKTIVTKMKNGLVCTSAGIDASNIQGGGKNLGDKIILLPENCDEIAFQIRERLESILGIPLAVIISDSLGTQYRGGSTGKAIGLSGMKGIDDRPGSDLFGAKNIPMQNIADEAASAAGLVMGQGGRGRPVVAIRGIDYERDVQAKAAGSVF